MSSRKWDSGIQKNRHELAVDYLVQLMVISLSVLACVR